MVRTGPPGRSEFAYHDPRSYLTGPAPDVGPVAPLAASTGEVDNRAMRHAIGIWLVVLVVLVGACSPSNPGSAGSTGGPASSPTGDQISSPPTLGASAVPSSPPSANPSQVKQPFTLSSPAFGEGAAIPARYTCDGEDESPEIRWSGAPDSTRALALTVLDPDAHDFVHWLVYDIPGTSDGTLPAAMSTASNEPPQGRNGFGKRGYGGPCPPSGTHHYVFTIYALDGPLGLAGTPTRSQIESAMQGHILARTTFTSVYKRH
jgi:Raf kinase inhibitor-like YbhB/YbcL family protein